MKKKNQHSQNSDATTKVKTARPQYSFSMTERGGLHLENSDGQKFTACSYFEIQGYVVDLNGQNPSYLICFKNMLGNQVTHSIPLAALASPENLAKLLLTLGFQMPQNNIKQRGATIKHFIECHRGGNQVFVRVNCDGWMKLQDGSLVYVFGNTVLGEQSNHYQPIRLPAVTASHRQGTPDQWHDLLKLLKHEPIAVMAICAALSAPLLEPLGFSTLMLFLVGPSSIGKTIILTLIASIFGSPDDLLTWEGTDNGIEANALQRKDKPLVIDEVGQANARQFAKLSYRLTNAASKQRAVANGEAVAVQRTRTSIISAGEVSPLDLIAQAGLHAKQGQIARLVAVPAQLQHGVWSDLGHFTSGAEKSHYIQRELQNVHGLAGKQFCRTLAKGIDVYAPTFHAIAEDLSQQIYTDSESLEEGVPKRVLRNFALFAYAGLIAVDKKTVPWSEKNVLDAMRQGYIAWLNDYKARQPKTECALLAPVRLFIQSQRGSKFKNLDSWQIDHEGAVAGFEHEFRDGEGCFLVFPTFFVAHLCDEQPEALVLEALKKAGYLRLGSRGVPTVQVTMPYGGGAKRSFYAIRKSILLG